MSKGNSNLFKGTSGLKKPTPKESPQESKPSVYMSNSYTVENNKDLVKKVIDNGDKINKNNTVGITQLDGKPVWLETGTNNAGLTHIINQHESNFKDINISKSHIADCIITAISKGTFVGFSNKRKDGKVFDVDYEGKSIRVNVVISSNGFIVTALPYSKRKKIWK